MERHQLALGGVRVIEVGGRVSGAYATKLLADLGADVIKVESPSTGDETRRSGPFPDDVLDPEQSGLFLHLNANKRGIKLDVSSPRGRGILIDLCEKTDIIIDTIHPDDGVALNLTPGDYHASNDRLIVVSLTPFGHSGPYRSWRGYDITTGALGGMCNYLGSAGRHLLGPPLAIVEYQSGLNAAVASLIGLLADAGGQHVDIAEADTWATIQNGMGVIEYIYGGRAFARIGRGVRGGPYPNAMLPCKDGYVRAIAIQRREWNRLVEVMGNPEWASDDRFQDRIKMNELYWKELDGYLTDWMADKTKQEVFDICQEARVPFGPVNTIQDIVDGPPFAQCWEDIDHPVAGSVRQSRPPYELSVTPARVRRGAPILGEHTAEVLALIDIGEDELAALARDGVV